MGNYGIKIAKAGKELTSTTPSDYHFWSKYRSKSIVYQGTLQTTTTPDISTDTNSYHHNFGYIPQFQCFVSTYDSKTNPTQYTNCDHYGEGVYEDSFYTEELTCYATATDFYVSSHLAAFLPQFGESGGIQNTYTFDIVLFMEEVETS